jgi:hypothetical protein
MLSSDPVVFCCGRSPYSVLMEQPGVLAALSRRRSRVQIPLGTLGGKGLRLETTGLRQRDCGTVAQASRLLRGTVRQLAERRSSNLRVCGFDSRLCHSSSASAGHRRAQVAVNHPPQGSAGSTPARRTVPARSSIGRTAAFHAAKAGSTPARVNERGLRLEATGLRNWGVRRAFPTPQACSLTPQASYDAGEPVLSQAS